MQQIFQVVAGGASVGRVARSLMVLAFVALAACGGEGPGGGPGSIQALYPDVEVSSASIQFSDVRVGTYLYRSLTIGNYGRANLELSDFSVSGDARGAFDVELSQSVVAPGGAVDLVLTYTPPNGGEDAATLVFTTNDPEAKSVEVALSGNGTIPSISLQPSPPFAFSNVSVGESASRDVLITNGGTGKLTLFSISIAEEYQADFSVTVPASFESGKQLAVGELVGVTVTYHPDSETGETNDRAVLIINSDDPRRSRFEAELLGSTEAAPIDLPPTVRFITPDPEDLADGVVPTYYVGRPAILEIHAEDQEDAADQLGLTWYSDIDGKLTTAPSGTDETGYAAFVTSALSVGEHTIRVFAGDTKGQSSSSETTIIVWNEESEFDYIIAGYDPGAAETQYRYFAVDDNIEITRTDAVTGQTVPCLVAFDDIRNNYNPTVCNAHIGDTIRIVVYDRYADTGHVDGLNLFFDESKQRLIEPFTVTTGVTGDACKDSPYKGQWYGELGNTEPYVDDCLILDQTIEVTIPLAPEEEE